jgi:hypothetical protein
MVARLLMTDHRLPRSTVESRQSVVTMPLLFLFYPLELRLRWVML